MSIDSKLLEILRCPLTKQSLSPLTKEKIDEINSKISMREIYYEDGTVVEDSIEEGLITENGNRIYRVESGIPIMLYKQSIPVT